MSKDYYLHIDFLNKSRKEAVFSILNGAIKCYSSKIIFIHPPMSLFSLPRDFKRPRIYNISCAEFQDGFDHVYPDPMTVKVGKDGVENVFKISKGSFFKYLDNWNEEFSVDVDLYDLDTGKFIFDLQIKLNASSSLWLQPSNLQIGSLVALLGPSVEKCGVIDYIDILKCLLKNLDFEMAILSNDLNVQVANAYAVLLGHGDAVLSTRNLDKFILIDKINGDNDIDVYLNKEIYKNL